MLEILRLFLLEHVEWGEHEDKAVLLYECWEYHQEGFSSTSLSNKEAIAPLEY